VCVAVKVARDLGIGTVAIGQNIGTTKRHAVQLNSFLGWTQHHNGTGLSMGVGITAMPTWHPSGRSNYDLRLGYSFSPMLSVGLQKMRGMSGCGNTVRISSVSPSAYLLAKAKVTDSGVVTTGSLMAWRTFGATTFALKGAHTLQNPFALDMAIEQAVSVPANADKVKLKAIVHNTLDRPNWDVSIEVTHGLFRVGLCNMVKSPTASFGLQVDLAL